MAELSPSLRAALNRESPEKWVALTKRLTLFAAWLLRGRRWRGSAHGVPPDGEDAQSIAADAIGQLFAGSSDWQPKSDPYTSEELEFELKCIVRATVRNLERRKENLSVSNEPDLSRSDEETAGESFFENFAGNTPQPDDDAMRRDALLRLQKFQAEFSAFLGADDKLLGIFKCVCAGNVKRDDQAKLLGLAPQEITNARKRLDRKLDQFAEARPEYPDVFIHEMKNA
jgi:hypothetical protein